jgi:hypothetical protein
MPSRGSNLKELTSYINKAPKGNREKIAKIANLYEEKKIENYRSALKTVVGLYLPSMMKKGEADRQYQEMLSRYDGAEPIDDRMDRKIAKLRGKLKRKRDQPYTLTLIFYCAERNKNPDTGVEDALTPEQRAKYKQYRRKGFGGLKQYWQGQLHVEGGSTELYSAIHLKLTKRGSPEWKKLYPILLTNDDFKVRETRAPGYLVGVYLMDYMEMSRGEGLDPAKLRRGRTRRWRSNAATATTPRTLAVIPSRKP